MMHIHTYHDEVVIKDIVKCWEKDDRGGVTEKLRPQFVRSQTKMIARVTTTRDPLSLEKFDQIPQMGRFTLRDEGKTICVGKVLKYKPYDKSKSHAGATAAAAETAAAATKAAVTNTSSGTAQELVYDMETGETRPKQPNLEQIAE